jgi:molybdopterin synthase sulfur carrier subunit
MKIRIKFFASCQELSGKSEEILQLRDGATVKDLRSKVMAIHPNLEKMGSLLLIAVNGVLAVDQTELTEGDAVAFFPPVSGG